MEWCKREFDMQHLFYKNPEDFEHEWSGENILTKGDDNPNNNVKGTYLI